MANEWSRIDLSTVHPEHKTNGIWGQDGGYFYESWRQGTWAERMASIHPSIHTYIRTYMPTHIRLCSSAARAAVHATHRGGGSLPGWARERGRRSERDTQRERQRDGVAE